ncbi:hypothetical protein B0H10DRAFT_2107541 [Mycena sp. CBHHK59/15]|nr:hypothetical protein B0H10DRAFT_2107541 [Mycena sp. CBHHK59/15]
MAAPQIQAVQAFPGISAPPPLGNPVTLADITNAHEYNRRIDAARHSARFAGQPVFPADTDLAAGLIYEKQVIELQAGLAAAPLWFQQWDQQRFQPLVDDVAELRIMFLIQAAQRGNEHRATGHQDPFSIVFFTDGTDPTAAPHLLPPLHNTDDIRALSVADSHTYCINYGLSQQGNVGTRQARIARHIGFYDDL